MNPTPQDEATMSKAITITLDLDEIRALDRAIEREIGRIDDMLNGLYAVDEDKLNARRLTLEAIDTKIAGRGRDLV